MNLDHTTRDWLNYHQSRAMSSTSWLGVHVLKSPLDLWVLQEIIYERQPNTVIEIGVMHGGSTLFIASVLATLREPARVIAIDNDMSRFVAKHPLITTVGGNSWAAETVRAVGLLVGGRTMVVQDGSHETPQVLADLRAYAPFVTPGQMMIVEDTIIDLFPAGPIGTGLPGPGAAVEAFLAEDTRFVREPKYERFGITYNPGGYLVRKAA